MRYLLILLLSIPVQASELRCYVESRDVTPYIHTFYEKAIVFELDLFEKVLKNTTPKIDARNVPIIKSNQAAIAVFNGEEENISGLAAELKEIEELTRVKPLEIGDVKIIDLPEKLICRKRGT